MDGQCVWQYHIIEVGAGIISATARKESSRSDATALVRGQLCALARTRLKERARAMLPERVSACWLVGMSV